MAYIYTIYIRRGEPGNRWFDNEASKEEYATPKACRTALNAALHYMLVVRGLDPKSILESKVWRSCE